MTVAAGTPQGSGTPQEKPELVSPAYSIVDPYSIVRVFTHDVMQVRRNRRMVLTLAGNVEIIGEAVNGSEAACTTESLRPDAALLDMEMNACSGW